MAEQKCIFLVDDNPIYLNTGKTALEEDFTVVTIPSGDKLMAVLQKALPDLILLDVEMPGTGGYEIIKKLKEDPKTEKIPVIFLTGKDQPEHEEIGRMLGAVDYIIKPFSPSLLRERILQHLPR